MAEQCRILIADPSEAVREALREILGGCFELQTCRDGRTALELLHRFRPDVLVLDLMLPGIDGLSLLQTAAEAGIRPATLATTRFQNDYILETAYRLGISYLMLRPCDTAALVDRILDLARRTLRQEIPLDLPVRVRRILIHLGFSASAKTYPVLEDAIVWHANNPGAFLSKELYPAVGKPYGIHPDTVEKRIRDLIHRTWKARDERIWRIYFQPDASGHIPCPSNSKFLSRITDHLPTLLEQSAGKNV